VLCPMDLPSIFSRNSSHWQGVNEQHKIGSNMDKKILVFAAIAIGLAVPAQAQSVSVKLGPDLIDSADAFEAGNFFNLGINEADINGSVDLVASFGNTFDFATVFNGAGGLASQAVDQNLVGGIIDAGAVATTAIGALNDGTVVTGGVTVSNELKDVLANGTGALVATAGAAVATGGLTADFDSLETKNSISGAMQDVYAANIAFNTGAISGSVDAFGLDISASGIKTTAVGAINTGVISIGN
jgi:hypothetical protein